MKELVTISATTETGFSDPVFKDTLPTALSDNGVSSEAWKAFLKQANENAKFSWNIASICCFFCNVHNRQVAAKLENFCEDDAPRLLPKGIVVSYKMENEKRIVYTNDNNGAGKGAQLITVHKLIFKQL